MNTSVFKPVVLLENCFAKTLEPVHTHKNICESSTNSTKKPGNFECSAHKTPRKDKEDMKNLKEYDESFKFCDCDRNFSSSSRLHSPLHIENSETEIKTQSISKENIKHHETQLARYDLSQGNVKDIVIKIGDLSVSAKEREAFIDGKDIRIEKEVKLRLENKDIKLVAEVTIKNSEFVEALNNKEPSDQTKEITPNIEVSPCSVILQRNIEEFVTSYLQKEPSLKVIKEEESKAEQEVGACEELYQHKQHQQFENEEYQIIEYSKESRNNPSNKIVLLSQVIFASPKRYEFDKVDLNESNNKNRHTASYYEENMNEIMESYKDTQSHEELSENRQINNDAPNSLPSNDEHLGNEAETCQTEDDLDVLDVSTNDNEDICVSETNDLWETVSLQAISPSSSPRASSNINLYKCGFENCDTQFSKSKKLINHIRRHKAERPYVCKAHGCSKSYTSSSHLRRHQKISHEGHSEQVVCKYVECGQILANQTSLKRHYYRKHNPNRQMKFCCPLCLKGFSKKRQLQKHQFYHTGKPFFRCDSCDNAFMTQGDLNRHKRTHTVYICLCEKSFERWSHLLAHKKICEQCRIHCYHCNRKFSSKTNLKIHLITHRPENREEFQCPYENCSRKYMYKKNLMFHINNRHLNKNWSERLPCTYDGCFGTFKNKKNLKCHIKVVHETAKVKKSRKPRKDKGQPKKALAAVLSGVELSPEQHLAILKGEKITDDLLCENIV